MVTPQHKTNFHVPTHTGAVTCCCHILRATCPLLRPASPQVERLQYWANLAISVHSVKSWFLQGPAYETGNTNPSRMVFKIKIPKRSAIISYKKYCFKVVTTLIYNCWCQNTLEPSLQYVLPLQSGLCYDLCCNDKCERRTFQWRETAPHTTLLSRTLTYMMLWPI